MSLAPRDPRVNDARLWGRGGVPWKFTEAQRAAMVRDYVAGVEPLAVIAARYGCSVAWPGKLARRAGFPVRRRVR